MATLTLQPAYLNLKFKSGDDFAFDITFPFSLSGYTIAATVGNTSFTVTPVSDTKITLSLTELQTESVNTSSAWKIKLTKNAITRTYISGNITKL